MPLASLSLSVLPYFILQRDLRLVVWFRNDEDPDQRGRELSHQSMTYHIWGTTVDMWSRLAIILRFCTLIILYFAPPPCKLTGIEVSNIIYLAW